MKLLIKMYATLLLFGCFTNIINCQSTQEETPIYQHSLLNEKGCNYIQENFFIAELDIIGIGVYNGNQINLGAITSLSVKNEISGTSFWTGSRISFILYENGTKWPWPTFPNGPTCISCPAPSLENHPVLDDFKSGSTYLFTGDLVFGMDRGCQMYAISLGAGLRKDTGKTFDTSDFGTLTVQNNISPVLSLGFNYGRYISSHVAVKLDVRLLTSIMNETVVQGPWGSEATVFDGGVNLGLIFGIGVGFYIQ